MKTIPLTRGLEAIVDDDDWEYLKKFKWYASTQGYAVMSIYSEKKNVKIKMHRFIMQAKKGQIIDHLSKNKLDNRKENLRVATASQNSQNTFSYGSVRLKGVSYDKRRNKYKAYIQKDKKSYYIGSFNTAFEAASAYDRMAIQLFGIDASTNEKIFTQNLKK